MNKVAQMNLVVGSRMKPMFYPPPVLQCSSFILGTPVHSNFLPAFVVQENMALLAATQGIDFKSRKELKEGW